MFGRLLRNWKQEIKNSFIRINGKRLSNAPIEGVNSRIKTIIKKTPMVIKTLIALEIE